MGSGKLRGKREADGPGRDAWHAEARRHGPHRPGGWGTGVGGASGDDAET